MQFVLDHDSDCFREAGGFFEPGVDIAAVVAAKVGQRDQRLRASAEIVILVAIEDAQALGSSPCISARLIGLSG